MKKLSVFKQITCLLAAAFGLLILCCVIIFQVMLRSWERTHEDAAAQALEKTAEQIVVRLDTVETYIRETAVVSQSLGFLTYEEDFDPVLSRKHLHNHISAMTSVCQDLDVLFVNTQKEGLYISRYNQGLKIADRIVFTQLLETGMFPEGKTWQLLETGDSMYLARVYTYGEYTSGAAVDLNNFLSAMEYCDEHSFYTVLDPQGRQCLTTQEGDLAIEDAYTVNCPLGGTGLTLCYTVDRLGSFAFAEVSGVLISMLLVLCGTTVMISLIILRQGVKKPIDQLLALTQQVIRGDHQSRISGQKDSPEFAILNGSINDMLDELEDLRITQYEKEIELRSQELKLLRNQIRPHFYLNAMSMINNMTYQDRNEDIREYLKCLSEHLRYAFSIDKQFVTLREELELTENYIRMQHIRYPGRVEHTIHAEPGLMNTSVMHYMLITLVENCFRHGFDVYSRMQIHICCTTDPEDPRRCLIRVSDNGPGFSDSAVAAFSGAEPEKKDTANTSVGLLNIKKTLQLQFGQRAAMELGGQEGRGAVVTIRLPVQEVQDEAFDRG